MSLDYYSKVRCKCKTRTAYHSMAEPLRKKEIKQKSKVGQTWIRSMNIYTQIRARRMMCFIRHRLIIWEERTLYRVRYWIVRSSMMVMIVDMPLADTLWTVGCIPRNTVTLISSVEPEISTRIMSSNLSTIKSWRTRSINQT